ncbi:hypothetical protein ACIQ7D_04235 [Streptomyces sp. NPDC096310]|uniref:hypothetical protein n=1 Tax=Streptomyces sp. NPDC096310 TaxID=3366082 RepID=UPI00381F936B
MASNWSSLGEVALIGVGATVGIVTVFSLGVRALAPPEVPSGDMPAGDDVERSAPLRKAVAALCFTACAGAVAYGLCLMVPALR